MDIVLIMIIALAGIAVLFMGTTAFFGYKYFLFKTKTPAAEYLKARKKKTPLVARFHEDGSYEMVASETQNFVGDKDNYASIAPLSTFTDLKTRQPVTAWFISPGVSGQTMAPKALAFTNEVRKLSRQENISKEAAVKKIVQESKSGDKQYYTAYGPLSFADIGNYLQYNDAKSNMEQANHQASLMRGIDKQLVKWILIIIAGGVVIVGIIAAIWLIGKYGFDGSTVDVKLTAETIRQAMDTASNATAVRP